MKWPMPNMPFMATPGGWNPSVVGVSAILPGQEAGIPGRLKPGVLLASPMTWIGMPPTDLVVVDSLRLIGPAILTSASLTNPKVVMVPNWAHSARGEAAVPTGVRLRVETCDATTLTPNDPVSTSMLGTARHAPPGVQMLTVVSGVLSPF